MPELPEVETVVRTLRPAIVGRKILNAEIPGKRILIGSRRTAESALAGRKILGVERHGKFIAIRLDRGWLVVHLGMTGRLLVNGDLSKWTHAIFTLDRGMLVYEDPRQFGRVEYSVDLPERVQALGPEPLEVPLDEFRRRLKQRKSPIKAVLLNQAVVRGVGNIYADELLFRAGVNPKRIAATLRPDRVERIWNSMREVLEEAIASRGSSIHSYVDAEGRQGGFQADHRVYQKTGEPCVNCGSPVKRILLAQRSTHYCPRCQK
ncbi:MAG TPA: bifunctional DNA-formamidopyrimidine glycosylase/DNA-(apurinic or apyrimidinic site) lyase [Bryobacteraceae bacterium]|jgi:formamidopyrimidine-DNA glycosylase